MSEATAEPVPEMGFLDPGKMARDEEWQREVGVMLHSIELMERVGTSGNDTQVLLQYVWDPAEVDLNAPKIEAVDGKVTPASIAAFSKWEDRTHPVWKLVIVEDLYDEQAGGVTGNPVAVVQITERRLEDLGRRLWLHPWYRRTLQIDWVPPTKGEDEARHWEAVVKRMARQRRRVEADLAARDD